MIAIQPKCEMEEKAIILRICVWFRPIHPPRATDRIAMMVSIVGLSEWEVMNSRAIGGSFMTVDRISPVVRGAPCSTSGNQKWNGTSPSFIERAAVRTRHDSGWVSWVMSHCPVCQALVIPENSTRVEAAA